jgi:AGCS family alanine or glycine:cation symporter
MNTSVLLTLLVTAVGVYLLFKLKFFFILHPIRTARDFISANKKPESRRALFLALAGTLGVGNIFGVAAGIIYGGAGMVFWLVVSSVFASVLKYSECVLCFSQSGECGGMHLVLKKSFVRIGKPLAYAYSAACVLLAFFMGSTMQAVAVSGAYVAIFHRDVLLPSIIFAIIVFLGAFGGGDRIEKITEFVIPLTITVYIFLCFASIIQNYPSLENVLSDILEEAKNLKSAAFGVGGYVLSKQFSEGFARGILSNEAGCGTSSLAHTRAKDRTPYIAGLSGICEVVFDTSVLCVLTALAILSSGVDYSAYSSPMLLVSDTVGTAFGELSRWLLLLSVSAFAYSTVICWFYYGSISSAYILPKFGSSLFAPLFFAFLVFGSLIPSRTIIDITDALLLILSLLTLSAVIRNRERIKTLTISKNGS